MISKRQNDIVLVVALLTLAMLVGATGRVILAVPLSATAPNLGQAASFSVIGKAGVTNTGNSVLSGKVGADSSVTGFPPGSSAGVVLAPAVNGAEADAGTADMALTAQAGGATPKGPNLTGLTLGPGVYSVGAAILPGVLTLNGPGVYIFLASSSLTTSGSVSLINGARPCDVFWHVTSGAALTGGSFVGTIIAGTSVTFGQGVSLNGRALALTGNVTLIGDSISGPGCPALPPPSPTLGPSPTFGPSPTSQPTAGAQPSYVDVTAECAASNGQGRVLVGGSHGVIVYGLGPDITIAADTGANKIVVYLPIGSWPWHAVPPAGHYMQNASSGTATIGVCPTGTATPGPGPTSRPGPTSASGPTSGPGPTAAATPTANSIPKPQTAMSNGYAGYAGASLGWVQLPSQIRYPIYAAVLDADGSLIVPNNGYAYWHGYFIGHLIQPKGWTILPVGGKITWQADHTLAFRVVDLEQVKAYNGRLEALPQGVYKIVTCWVDYNATRDSNHTVWGGNLIADLTVQ